MIVGSLVNGSRTRYCTQISLGEHIRYSGMIWRSALAMPSMPPCRSSMESPPVRRSSSAHQQAFVGISNSGRSTGPKPSVSCVSSLNFLNMVTSQVTSTSP